MATNNISTLGQSLQQVNRIRTLQSDLSNLQQQLTTGKKSQDFAGLGKDALTSQSARSEINSLETFINNIEVAQSRNDQKQSALSKIREQIDTVVDSINSTNEQGSAKNFENVRDLAGRARELITDLVNKKDGERFLFSGAASRTKPLQNTGLLDSFVKNRVDEWKNEIITTDQFIDQYNNANETTLGYAPEFTNDKAGKELVRVDDKSEIDTTVLADSSGIKEAIRALGVLEQLPDVEDAPGSAGASPNPTPNEQKQQNFFKVLDDLGKTLAEASQDVKVESDQLGQQQARMQTILEEHKSDINNQKDIISRVEEVNTTEVATKIQQVQTQLRASFQVTSQTSQLTLTNFL
jgi:flagellar hook-associated protein 3 FlgL